MRNQGVCKDYFSRLYTSLDDLPFFDRAETKLAMLARRVETKLAMLAFLYCGEFVKNYSQPFSHAYLNQCTIETVTNNK